jgi:adenylate cyclase
VKGKEDMPHLQIITHNEESYNFPLVKDKTTIGRSKDNDIVLPDPRVSSKHAEIITKGKSFILNDLASHNGTRVNEEFIQSHSLKHDDEIRLGQYRLTFLTKEKTVSTPTKTLLLEKEGDYGQWHQQTLKINPEESCQIDSQSLLISPEPKKSQKEQAAPARLKKKEPHTKTEKGLLSPDRANKVLFVLYEISRQLNTIHDFNELLKKIMDYIFMVIDADYGFLILTDDDRDKDFIPVVIKYKDDKVKTQKGIRASRTIIKKVIQDKVALLTSNAMVDPRFGSAESLVGQNIRSAMCVPLWRKDEIIGVIQLDSIRADNQYTEDDLELLKTISCQMAMILEQASLNEKIREEELMRNRLERFHSPQVIDMIIKSALESMDDLMDAKDREATILFTDIIGFTSLTENMQPREINTLLNQFFSRMTDIVFEHDGTLDKYIGDSLMAIFGAPIEKKDDAERAVSAAIQMRRELFAMIEKAERNAKFGIRIGINTGHVVAGNIGSPKRMEYTVIGTPVNIASRLESLAQPNQIIIGEKTYQRVKGKFKIKEIGSREVKGASEPVKAYEVLD